MSTVKISNMLINYKVQYVVILFTVLYWIFGVIVRFSPSTFISLDGFWWSVYVNVVIIFIITNIICIILLILMLYFKTWNLKYTWILLVINGLTMIFGNYFIAFPLIMF